MAALLNLKTIAAFIAGLCVALVGFEAYDRWFDDPAMFKAGQEEMAARVARETNDALKRAQEQIEQARIETEKIVRRMNAEATQRRVDLEKLIDEFNARPDAGDLSGIDGRFVR
ncbi:MAG: hypothetical protein JJ930_09765 [Roseitalea sp.]|nr:hypothetical protein [Roseitalea sp.]